MDESPTLEPEAALRMIKADLQPNLYVMCDLHPFLDDNPRLVRLLKEIAMSEAAQVLHHLLQGAVVGTHAYAAIAFAPTRRFVTHDAQQFVFRRQRETETCRETLHFSR